MLVDKSRIESTRDKPPTLRAVLAFMVPASLARDRRGTAAIEFALVLPVMLLLGVGLVDTVFRNLLMIDVEMAADTGTRMALLAGTSQDRIAGAMAGFADAGLEMEITALQCASREKPGKKDKDSKSKKDDNNIIINKNSDNKFESVHLIENSSDICNELPYGRYMKISATTHHLSLVGSSRSEVITAVNYVRLP